MSLSNRSLEVVQKMILRLEFWYIKGMGLGDSVGGFDWLVLV